MERLITPGSTDTSMRDATMAGSGTWASYRGTAEIVLAVVLTAAAAAVGYAGIRLPLPARPPRPGRTAEIMMLASGQPGNLVLVSDIDAKALGGAAIVTDGAAKGSDLVVAGPAIDRDGGTVTRRAPLDHRPQAPRAARHQSDAPTRHCHVVMISLRPARRADASALRAQRTPCSARLNLSAP